MQEPTIPNNESERLESLRQLLVLDTPAEERFDRLTRLAKEVFQVPIALVSLVDSGRQWFKSKQGLEACETPRNISFCGHAILSSDILYVPNALEDARFADNPLVTNAPHIRFYAGAPLTTVEGYRVGTLCIIDDKPRSLSTKELRTLRDLADCVQDELNRARALSRFHGDASKPASGNELSLQARVEAEIKRNHQLLNIISRAQSQFIKESENKNVFDELLREILQLTDSEYGFIGEILYTPENQPYLKSHALTNIAWNEETSRFYEENAPQGLEFYNLNTLFGATITSGQAVISNNPSQDSRRGGLPQGHPPLNAFLGVPFFAGDNFIGMAGLANRPQGYDEQLVEFIQPLLATCANLIDALRQEKRRRQAEEELNRFKHVLDDTLDMIFMFDAETLRFNYLNQGAINSMGYTHDEFMQLTPYEIKPLISETEFRTLITPLLTSKKSALHFETLHRRKDGSDFPVEIFLQLVKDDGNQGRFVAIVRDISERKAAEQESKCYTSALERLHTITTHPSMDLQQKIHALLDLGREVFDLPLAIVSCIEGDRYIVDYISGPEGAPPAGTEFSLQTTYCVHTLQADRPLGFHHAGISEICSHPCYQTFKLESYIGAPLMVGTQRYGTLNFSGPEAGSKPFSQTHYSLIQLFAQWVGNELAQYRINQELLEVTAWRQTILDSANASIISTDIDGIIQTFNKGAERMLGYSAEEVISKVSPAIIHDENEVVQRAEELSKELGYTIEPGFEVFVAKARLSTADEREWTYIRKDGSRFPVLLSVTAVRDSFGDIKGYLGIASDLTERKKVDRMKSEFVSTVSHELRTPLTSIRGALGLLLGKSAAELSPRSRNLLEMANRNSERLTLLINDILDLEKIESGRLEFHFELVDLIDVSRTAVEANEGYAQQHNIMLRLYNEVDRAMIWGDSHRLLQVFANLISNAVKYSPPDDVVEISISRHKNFFRVSVNDSGSGIPDEFRSRIFQRFAQADSSDTREKGGTGLGLSICKAIVERHHGRIQYDSEPNKGTVFYFDLPQWHAPDTKKTTSSSPQRVLICEDNMDVATILNEFLQQENVAGDIAASAEAARGFLQNSDYALLLLDLSLPDADGMEFLRELRSQESTRQLPIIVISGRAEEGRSAFKGSGISVVDWLQKPLDKTKFSELLHETLRGRQLPVVLHVEDDLDMVQVTQLLLDDMADYRYATNLKQARNMLEDASQHVDLVILDLNLPDGSGVDLFNAIQGHCPIVVLSGNEPSNEISEKAAAALIKSKTNSHELLETIKRVLNQSQEEL
ncbi:PAS domain S-box protein [Kaarinaea lacus]